jgi:hypothetical protein
MTLEERDTKALRTVLYQALQHAGQDGDPETIDVLVDWLTSEQIYRTTSEPDGFRLKVLTEHFAERGSWP